VTDISIVWICVRRPLAAMMGSLVTVAAVMARLTAHPGASARLAASSPRVPPSAALVGIANVI
jgi:hypothetical protein